MSDQARSILPPEERLPVQDAGRGDKRIPVHFAIAKELRVFQSGDRPEYALLFRVFQVRLEADEVVRAAVPVILTQLQTGRKETA